MDRSLEWYYSLLPRDMQILIQEFLPKVIETNEEFKEAIKKYLSLSHIQECYEKYGLISHWRIGKNVTDMSHAFKNFKNFNSDISNWDVSNVTNMAVMFNEANAFNSDISKWNVSNVTNMDCMFRKAESFNSDLSEWDVSNVKSVAGMFCRATSFDPLTLPWNVSNVVEMQFMFFGAINFKADISKWILSSVVFNVHMLCGVTNFNKSNTEKFFMTINSDFCNNKTNGIPCAWCQQQKNRNNK